jgi:chorismate mutase-like protein
MKPTLEQLRHEIDQLDQQILPLLNRRAALAVEIGAIKQSNGAALYVPARERAVLQRLVAGNEGPLSHRSICRIYAEIMAASLALEHEVTVFAAGAPEAELVQAVRYVAGGHATLRMESDPARLISAFAALPDAFIVLTESWVETHRTELASLGAVWKGSWRIPAEETTARYHLYVHAESNPLASRPATVYGLVDAGTLRDGVPPVWMTQIPASSVDYTLPAADEGWGILQWKMELSARDTREEWLDLLSRHCRAVWIVS